MRRFGQSAIAAGDKDKNAPVGRFAWPSVKPGSVIAAAVTYGTQGVAHSSNIDDSAPA